MRTAGLLEDIKSRIDIVEFVSSYVKLTKAGQNWKGICPFHSEKTPSFMVSPSKQIFHCFGCGAGGDVITFASRYENITFNEALGFLAKRAGIPLTAAKGASRAYQKQERIRDALREAADFYAQRLHAAPHALAYLEGRGVSAESLGQFKVGYAPQGWDNLLRHLRKAGYGDDIIREAGLAVAGTKGPYDMFRNRIVFPITGTGGAVLAFGGRALDEATPKYINSPETEVFKKSDTLFGLDRAKEAIRRDDTATIVEGYMDVVMCHQYGFRNAVAPLGTALTAGQLQKLRTMTGNLLLVFDGDEAGKAAAKRSLALVAQNGFRSRVLMLPPDDDPDSFLREKGAGAFAEMLGQALSMVGFLVGTARGGKAAAVREALGVLAGMTDALLAEEMLVELADMSKMNEATVRQEFRKMRSRGPAPRPCQGQRPLRQSEERLLLSAVIAFPEKADYVCSRLDIEAIKDPIVGALFRRIAGVLPVRDVAAATEGASEDERRLVTRLSVEPGFDLEHVDRNIEDCFRLIDRTRIEERLRCAQQEGDLGLINSLICEKRKFMKEAGQ